jgi:hypothetical protein
MASTMLGAPDAGLGGFFMNLPLGGDLAMAHLSRMTHPQKFSIFVAELRKYESDLCALLLGDGTLAGGGGWIAEFFI